MGFLVLMIVTVGATAVAIITAIAMLLVLFNLMHAAALNLERRPAPVNGASGLFAHERLSAAHER